MLLSVCNFLVTVWEKDQNTFTYMYVLHSVTAVPRIIVVLWQQTIKLASFLPLNHKSFSSSSFEACKLQEMSDMVYPDMLFIGHTVMLFATCSLRTHILFFFFFFLPVFTVNHVIGDHGTSFYLCMHVCHAGFHHQRLGLVHT